MVLLSVNERIKHAKHETTDSVCVLLLQILVTNQESFTKLPKEVVTVTQVALNNLKV